MDRPDVEQWKGREVARLLALVETERRYYQEIVASVPAALAVIGRPAIIKSANRSFRQMFAMRSEDMTHRTVEQVLPSETLAANLGIVFEHAQTTTPFFIEAGTRRMRVSVVPLRNWDDETDLEALLIVEDVTGLVAPAAAPVAEPSPVHAEPPVEAVPAAIAEAEPPAPAPALAAPPIPPPAVPDIVPAMIWSGDVLSQQFTVVAGEAAGVAHAGVSSAEIHRDDRDRVVEYYRAALAKPGRHACEYRCTRGLWYRDAFIVEAGADGNPVRVAGVVTDVTARRHYEQMTQQAQRLEAMAGLSRTLTHELNNTLMVVTGYGEELLSSFHEGDARHGEVQEILTAANRISALSGQLLPFTRKQAFPPEPVKVAEAVARSIDGENVETHVPKNLGVMADPGQLEEIVRALLGRARDHGRVAISSRAISIDEFLPDNLAPGKYVEIVFSVPGMPAIPLDLLLPAKDPAGPDIARAHALVREWGGGIWQDAGELHMLLPAAPEVQPKPEPVAVPEPVVEPEPQAAQPETVLIVEDEHGIRALMRKILRRQNYEVLEAGTPDEAVEVAMQYGDRINLLVTDMTLPQRSGRQLAEELCAKLPRLKVLYVSGYTDDASVYEGDIPAGADFLQKPFTLGSLLKKVRDVLDQQA